MGPGLLHDILSTGTTLFDVSRILLLEGGDGFPIANKLPIFKP